MYALWTRRPDRRADLRPGQDAVVVYLVGGARRVPRRPSRSNDAPLAVGASGAIFGLFGILFAASRMHLPMLDRRGRAILGQIGIPDRDQHRLRVRDRARSTTSPTSAGSSTGLLLGVAFVPSGVQTLTTRWQPGTDGRSVRRGFIGTPAASILAIGILAVGIAVGLVVGFQGWSCGPVHCRLADRPPWLSGDVRDADRAVSRGRRGVRVVRRGGAGGAGARAGWRRVWSAGRRRGRGPGIVAAWQTAAASTPSAVKATLLGPFSAARLRGGDPIAWGEAVGAVAADLAAAGCPLVEIEEPEAVAAAADAALRGGARRRAPSRRGRRRRARPPVARADRRQRRRSRRRDALRPAVRQLRVRPDRRTRELAADRRGARRPRHRLRRARPGRHRRRPPRAARLGRPLRGVDASAAGWNGSGLANASSLASLPRDRAIRKLAALAEAARLASIADPHELAASIDPRAVDARSAALGEYRPPR